ncbi:MAG: hypothetical protein QXM93_09520 [Candidatus Methanomethyliaceae archaeon]
MKREDFLERLGFTHDPFGTPIAEQELGRRQQAFYAYYTPFYSPDHPDLLKTLRTSQHGFVYGSPGQGKSTLRLTLEADCRTVFDGTLTLTYLMGEDITRPLTSQEHGARLTEALAIDLTLSIIEQFNPLNPFPDPDKLEALKAILPAGGHVLSRFFYAITSETIEVDPLWGISQYWKYLGKAPVKYIELSPSLQKLLRQLKQAFSAGRTSSPGWETFWQGVKVANTWGFDEVFVLVDGVDDRERDMETMFALLKPLLEILSEAESQRLFFKFFLPTELKRAVEGALKTLYPYSFFSIMISWNEETLRRLLAQRLRAAISSERVPYPSLDSLATPHLELEQKVIQAAQCSPRRLLQILSALIDAHVRYRAEERFFDEKDWEDALQLLGSDPLEAN